VKKSILIVTFFILFKPLFPIVEYYINYDYISKVLCVNRNSNTIVGCDGKCYLYSELARMAKGEEPISDKKIVIKHIEILFCQEIKSLDLSKAPLIQNPILNTNYSNLYTYLNSCSVFHPPSTIV
jgi:hypothetical protein